MRSQNIKSSDILASENSKIKSSQVFGFLGHIAEDVGVTAAIIYNHVIFWLKVNKLANRNQIDGRTWMYETYTQIQSHLSFFTYKEIRNGMDILVSKGYLIKENHNQAKFDKTNWYALTNEHELGESKINYCKPVRADDRPIQANQYGCGGTPIPDKQPDKQLTKECIEASPPVFISRRENISTSYEDHEKLIQKYGKELTEKAYDLLSTWKKDHPESPKTKKPKTDIGRIHQWAMTAAREAEIKEKELSLREKKLENGGKPVNLNKEYVEKYFENGETYAGTDCFIDSEGVAFQRGMNHQQLKFSEKGFKDQFTGLVRKFDIYSFIAKKEVNNVD